LVAREHCESKSSAFVRKFWFPLLQLEWAVPIGGADGYVNATRVQEYIRGMDDICLRHGFENVQEARFTNLQGQRSHSMIGPASGIEGPILWLDINNLFYFREDGSANDIKSEKHARVIEEVSLYLKNLGGRPHMGKMYLWDDTDWALYPRVEEFKGIVRTYHGERFGNLSAIVKSNAWDPSAVRAMQGYVHAR